MSDVTVVDTNVLIAGILTSDPNAPTARIVDGLLARSFAYALSEALLVEYRIVLLRPKIVRRHGLGPLEVDELLTRLTLDAIVSEPIEASTIEAPDRTDQFLWDLLASLTSPILVTGETRLRAGRMPNRGKALSPAEFCRALRI